MSQSESSYVDSGRPRTRSSISRRYPTMACAHDGELPADAGYCRWSWCDCDCAHNCGDGVSDPDPDPSEL